MNTAADALHHLAEQAFTLGRPDVAADLLRQAARIMPPRPDENPDQLHAGGLKALQADRLGEAEPRLLRAVQLRPTNADWHEHLAVLFAKQRRFAEAANTFRVALRLDPAPAGRWHNLALAYRDSGNLPAAEGALCEAIQRNPQSPQLRAALVNNLNEQKRPADALAEARRTTEELPANPAGWSAVGLLLANAGDFEGAASPLAKAAELNPTDAEAHSNLAAVYGKLRRWADSEKAARAAVERNPKHATAWGNLGNCLRDQGKYDDATTALTRALDLNPTDADAAGNFALTFAAVGRHTDALKWYDRSLQHNPRNGEVRFNRALTHLTLGNYADGWAGYEHRWDTEALRGKKPALPKSVAWRGEDLKGKTILLLPEQGMGDYVQFVRFAKPLADRGAEVVVQAPPGLEELTRGVPGVRKVVGADGELTIHYHCQLPSLPGLLKLTLDQVRGTPYLTPPPAAVAKWAGRLNVVPGFKVGVVWQGNPKHTGDRWRSVPLALFAPLAAVPGVNLVSIQKGHGREQMEDVTFPMFDFGDELADFSDTAGLLANLDLVITVDSAVAHLAGATGAKVWTLISANNDWRWLTDRTDTPWYDSMTLIRQPKVQDWPAAFADAEKQLQATVK